VTVATKLDSATKTLEALNGLIALGGPLAIGAVALGRQIVAVIRGYSGNKDASYDAALAAAKAFEQVSKSVSDDAVSWLNTHPAID
jgi:hypothetical protein